MSFKDDKMRGEVREMMLSREAVPESKLLLRPVVISGHLADPRPFWVTTSDWPVQHRTNCEQLAQARGCM